jgi:bifunctional non-homologous end joining protein LigD
MLYVQDARGLLALVQFNAIEFHGWGARVPRMRRPDQLVIDLDPDESLPFARVVEAALEIRDVLAHVDLQSFVKTTGGKGLHVVVPILPEKGWDDVKAFTRAIADTLAARRPDRYIATMAKAQRKGKIFVDYLRNGEGATAVMPYSARARKGLTVAVPVAWKELASVDPQELRVDNVAQWFGRRRKDPWEEWPEVRQSLPHLRD